MRLTVQNTRYSKCLPTVEWKPVARSYNDGLQQNRRYDTWEPWKLMLRDRSHRKEYIQSSFICKSSKVSKTGNEGSQSNSCFGRRAGGTRTWGAVTQACKHITPLNPAQGLFPAHPLCAGHSAGNTAASTDFAVLELKSDRSLGTARFYEVRIVYVQKLCLPRNMQGPSSQEE